MLALEPMRMTPAGVPSIRFTVEHRSTVEEAGHPRQVECRLRVAALGPMAEAASRVAPGSVVEIEGFLTRASYRSEWPVLHVTQLRTI